MAQAIRDVSEIMRDEMVFKDKIIALLRDGPKTILEIAEALDYPSHEVVYWVMGMWRYGVVVETGRADDEGYYHYQLTE
jgi:predicted transcriptional regulator